MKNKTSSKPAEGQTNEGQGVDTPKFNLSDFDDYVAFHTFSVHSLLLIIDNYEALEAISIIIIV